MSSQFFPSGSHWAELKAVQTQKGTVTGQREHQEEQKIDLLMFRESREVHQLFFSPFSHTLANRQSPIAAGSTVMYLKC